LWVTPPSDKLELPTIAAPVWAWMRRPLSGDHPLAADGALCRRQVVVALGQLLDRLAVGDVADEEAQLIQIGNVLGNGLEAGEEEVADGKVGSVPGQLR